MFNARDKAHGFNRLKRLYWANMKRDPKLFNFSRFLCDWHSCGTQHCLAGYLLILDPTNWERWDGSMMSPVGLKSYPRGFSITWLQKYFSISEKIAYRLFMPRSGVHSSEPDTWDKVCKCGCNGHRLSYSASFDEAMANFKETINELAKKLKLTGVK